MRWCWKTFNPDQFFQEDSVPISWRMQYHITSETFSREMDPPWSQITVSMLLFPNSKLSTNKPPSIFCWKFTGHLDRTHIAPFPFKIKVEWLRSLPSWCFIPCGFLCHRSRNSMVSRGLGDKCSLVVYWNSSFFVHSSIFDSVRRLSFWHSMRSGWGENKCKENGSTDIAVCFTILKRMLEEPPKPYHLKISFSLRPKLRQVLCRKWSFSTYSIRKQFCHHDRWPSPVDKNHPRDSSQ